MSGKPVARRVLAGPRSEAVGPVLVTDRLALRRLTAADAGHLLALDGDPAVMRFLDGRLKTRAEIEAEVLPPLLAYYAQHPGFGRWAAETRSGGDFIGWFALRAVAPTEDPMDAWPDESGDVRVASLGYRLRRGAWGHGYATEGARALVRRAFTELGVAEIVATTMAVNARSRAVMDRAGLRYARTVHLSWPDPLPGNEQGDVEYRLRRADWIALQA
jgi:RimJ/RimL family protein N-acetyltransferase